MMPSRIVLALVATIPLCSCLEDDRVTGGADDHGNALARILVVDSAGNPSARSEIVVRPRMWLPGDPLDSMGERPNGTRLVTGADGTCQVRLRRGDYTVRAGRGNIAGATTVRLEDSMDVVVGLYPTGAVRGRFLEPLGKAWISVRGYEGRFEVDSTGGFLVPFVPVGGIELILEDERRTIELNGVNVLDRKISDVGSIHAQGTAGLTMRPITRIANEPLPPVFLKKAGVYSEFQKLEIVPPILGDGLEVSVDGSKWARSNGILRIGAGACIAARSVQADNVRSAVSEACYSIESQ